VIEIIKEENMAHICTEDYCDDKEIADGEAVACCKHRSDDPMHKACFERHNADVHNGTAVARTLPDPDM
jgi:hypothetical protein